MKRILAFTAAALLLGMSQAQAWGSRGHKIVAHIAQAALDKSVIDSVKYYLDETSFGEAAVWMDEVRSDHNYDYMKPMHYINVEKDKTYVKTSGPNIINELNRVMSDLQNRRGKSKDVIKQDLMMLFHLVGDLHMPLHAGYGDDKGGNDIKVDFLGTSSNLHRVWDTNIIEDQNITANSCIPYLNSLSVAERKDIQTIDVVKWMDDSRALLPEAYDFKDGVITKSYVEKNVPVIEKQLGKAGLRLASALTQIFSIPSGSGSRIK